MNKHSNKNIILCIIGPLIIISLIVSIILIVLFVPFTNDNNNTPIQRNNKESYIPNRSRVYAKIIN